MRGCEGEVEVGGEVREGGGGSKVVISSGKGGGGE